ncbi:MAG: hypothetical protein NUV74_11125 [Candidatus Brocadiaceae bacterium]|nr:hypothetical protein [Candidatus Brocadiaceae bacterium]
MSINASLYHKIESLEPALRDVLLGLAEEIDRSQQEDLREVKVRPSKKEIDRFLKITEWIKRVEECPETYLLFVAHDYHPDTEQYLKGKGIRYFWSYELEQDEM